MGVVKKTAKTLFAAWVIKLKLKGAAVVTKGLAALALATAGVDYVEEQLTEYRKEDILGEYDRRIKRVEEAIRDPNTPGEDKKELNDLLTELKGHKDHVEKYGDDSRTLDLAEEALKAQSDDHSEVLKAAGLDEIDIEELENLSMEELKEELKRITKEKFPHAYQAINDFINKYDESTGDKSPDKSTKSTKLAKPAKSSKFDEQGFLIDNIDQFNNPIKYNNFVKVIGGDPYRFFSKATTSQKTNQFVNATPQQLSGLIPYIKMWKITYPSKGHAGIPVELKFKNKLSDKDIEAMTHGRGNRGAGVGIKNFSWDMSGSNQVTAGRLITSKLVLLFQDINSLTAETNGVSFIDLIKKSTQYLKTPETTETEKCKHLKVWNEKYYRIKIQVGWSAAKESQDLNSLHDAVEASRRNFYLSMFAHDINFKDDGTIELTLHLQSTIESLMRSVNTDILLMDDNPKVSQFERELCIEKSKSVSDKEETSKETKEKIKKELEKIKSNIGEEKLVQYRNFVEKMDENGFIHYIDVPPKDLKMWNAERLPVITISGETYKEREADAKKKLMAQFQNAKNKFDHVKYNKWYYKQIKEGNFTRKIASDWTESLSHFNRLERQMEEDYKPSVWEHGGGQLDNSSGYILEGNWSNKNKGYTLVSKDNRRIHYIYLGSILEVAFSVLREDSGNIDKIEEMRNIIGTINFVDPKNNKQFIMNLADIPVSFKLFQNWFFNTCVKRNLSFWHLSQFLLDLVDSFFIATIKTVQNVKTVHGIPYLKVTPADIPLNSEGLGSWSCPLTGARTVREFNETQSIDGDKVFAQERDFNFSSSGKDGKYLFIHMGNYVTQGIFSHDPDSTMVGRRTIDEKSGIPHFKIGANRGLIKNIKFKKIENPFLKAHKMLTQGESGLGGISELYNADIEMVGNAIYKPGSFIYIDTSALSSEVSLTHEMGLGGYYMVTSVKSEINSNNFKTSLQCAWSSSGTRRATDEKPISPLAAPPSTPAVGDPQ